MEIPRRLDFDAFSSSCDEEEISSSPISSPVQNGFEFCQDSGIAENTSVIFDVGRDSNTSQGSTYEKIEFPNVPNFMDVCNNNRTGSPVRVHTLPDRLALGLYSPPYKRVRAMRLFDAPTAVSDDGPRFDSPEDKPCVLTVHTPAPLLPRSRLFLNLDKPVSRSTPRVRTISNSDKPAANVNPFTPRGLLLASKKRSRSKRSLTDLPPAATPYCGDDSGNASMSVDPSESAEEDAEQATKKMALHDSNISRYHQEFHEICLIGKGSFGSVFKCLNRLDGCVYAIKKSLKPVAGSVNERLAMSEVYGLAALAKHNNVVSYYSAWTEDDHVYIQNEYCNGGSVAEAIERGGGGGMGKPQMRQLALQVAEGLKFIHSKGLVHMDIKPANIFISRETLRERILSGNESDEDEMPIKDEEGMYVWYKIGDFGHVTSVIDPRVEEGDCRYLPTEILQEQYDRLPRADIFSLGVTLYEAEGGGPLPKNGDEWHAIRAGRLTYLEPYGADFNQLLKLMVDPDPARRPTASGLTRHPALGCETRLTLNHQLAAERLKTEILTKQLAEAVGCLHRMPKKILVDRSVGVRKTGSLRFVGKKTHRSQSTGSF